MSSMKRAVVLAFALLMISTSSFAAEGSMKTMFQDILYGGLSGALLGGAVLAFTKHPGNHLDYVGYGAAGGAIVGATVGAVTISKSLAEINNGEVKFAMPTITPDFKEGRGGRSVVIATAELVRGKF